MKIVRPLAEHLPSFIAALEQGWSPDTTRGPEAAKEALEVVQRDPAKFLERAVDREAAGDPVKLPDGSKVARIPGYNFWMWDGEFCGTIGFRWVPGTPELPGDPSNAPSIKVIEANGGVLFERFTKPAQFGGAPGLRYRIPFG